MDTIVKQFPTSFAEFREPFVGGGSAFVRVRQMYPDRKVWINDLYEKVYLFWRECSAHSASLIDASARLRVLFADGRDLYNYLLKNMNGFNDLDKAAAFFALNRITFSGVSESGGYSDESFRKRFTVSSLDRLQAVVPLVKSVRVTNLDYTELLRDGDDVFIFCDPPYFSAEGSGLYGKKGDKHKGFDHERFAESMKACKHRWLITYDNSRYIKDLFSFAKIEKWNITYGMKNAGQVSTRTNYQKAKEIFIKNF